MSGADGAVLAGPDGAEMPTIADLRRALTEQFRAAGIESPELDARILVGHALSLDHAALAATGARLLESGEQNTIAELARRRLTREPVARIVGSKEFWSLKLAVNSSTLVPRPETETVVEAALAAIDADGPRTRTLRIADLGTGSGALLLALLAELPNAFGVGTDISSAALLVAQDNAQRLKFGRAAFVACDLAAALGGPFDLIVSNPPYIASSAIATLAPEVRDFDPHAALDGGPDGLDFYRLIATSAPPLLKAGGALIVELGIGQAPAAAALLSGMGLLPSPPHYDLQGLPRAITAKKVA
ncbi:MAG: peptide chain release factor N(5)-glutamine methyltransferase [Xanthobacteraceae bacterium]